MDRVLASLTTDCALHIFRLITFFKKGFVQHILDKTILNQIAAKDLLNAMRINSLCQTFFHLVDKRFYRKLTLFSFCRYHEKPDQVSGVQIIVDSNDQDSTDELLRDSTHFGCLDGNLEILFTSRIACREAQSENQDAENQEPLTPSCYILVSLPLPFPMMRIEF